MKADDLERKLKEEFDAIFECVKDFRDYLRDIYTREELTDCEGEEPRSDIRLQYDLSTWWVHTGGPCYDTDHCGYWGASTVSPDDTDEQCKETVRDLINDVCEDCAMSCDDDDDDDEDTE